MPISIHPNALKHGLDEEQIVAAFQTGHATAMVRSRDGDSEPVRWATVGLDQAGRPIELVFVMMESGPLIFHANKLTAAFRKELNL